MDETERQLRAAIAAEPDSPEPRLVYADWLEERGDSRGDLLRAMIEGDSARAIELAGITVEVDEYLRGTVWELRAAISPVAWLRFGADCVDRVLVKCPGIPGMSQFETALEFVRTGGIAGDFEFRHHAEISKASLEDLLDRCQGSEEARVFHAAIVLTRARFEFDRWSADVQHNVRSVALTCLAAIGWILHERAFPDWDKTRWPTDSQWQVDRLCEYVAFGEPLTRAR